MAVSEKIDGANTQKKTTGKGVADDVVTKDWRRQQAMRKSGQRSRDLSFIQAKTQEAIRDRGVAIGNGRR